MVHPVAVARAAPVEIGGHMTALIAAAMAAMELSVRLQARASSMRLAAAVVVVALRQFCPVLRGLVAFLVRHTKTPSVVMRLRTLAPVAVAADIQMPRNVAARAAAASWSSA